MIDKNGRLFGKINIIDLIIIIVLILIVCFIGYRFLGIGNNQDSAQTVYISFYDCESADFVVNGLEEGSAVYNGTDDAGIGTLKSFEIGDARSYELDPNTGEIIRAPKEDYSSVIITVEAQGVIGNNGVTINGVLYGIGHSAVVYAGDCKFYPQVYSIEAAD